MNIRTLYYHLITVMMLVTWQTHIKSMEYEGIVREEEQGLMPKKFVQPIKKLTESEATAIAKNIIGSAQKIYGINRTGMLLRIKTVTERILQLMDKHKDLSSNYIGFKAAYDLYLEAKTLNDFSQQIQSELLAFSISKNYSNPQLISYALEQELRTQRYPSLNALVYNSAKQFQRAQEMYESDLAAIEQVEDSKNIPGIAQFVKQLPESMTPIYDLQYTVSKRK